MLEILFPVLLLLGIAVFCAALLTLAAVFFAVKEITVATALLWLVAYLFMQRFLWY